MTDQTNLKQGTHAAEAAALGFYYQAFFALLLLLDQDGDDATVAVERLDDVELTVEGSTFLNQLKHSLGETQASVTLASVSLWKSLKVWIDELPNLNLAETSLHLVTTAPMSASETLQVLLDANADRSNLVNALTEEAERVVAERAAAAARKVTPLPHAARAAACQAFLNLEAHDRLNLLRRVQVKPGTMSVAQIEEAIAQRLRFSPPEHRPGIAKQLVQWWDREIVYSLCGKRPRQISRIELQQKISTCVAEIEQALLLPEFEQASPPDDYQSDGMLTRQIRLVDGGRTDLANAIREEWRAREQRASWLEGNAAMASTIDRYDKLLQEHWADRHARMAEDCVALEPEVKAKAGLEILRWTHESAPNTIRPIQKGWDAAYYVRGSYQVLAIGRTVGWHADYQSLLETEE